MTRTRIVRARRRGLEWGDAGLGGVATLALIVLVASGAMMLQPGSRSRRR